MEKRWTGTSLLSITAAVSFANLEHRSHDRQQPITITCVPRERLHRRSWRAGSLDPVEVKKLEPSASGGVLAERWRECDSRGQRRVCSYRRLLQPLSSWPLVSKPTTTPLLRRSGKHLDRYECKP